MKEPFVAGIDVAAKRPCTCVLVAGSEVKDEDWLDTSDLEELAAWIKVHEPDAIAVDAPCALSAGLLLEPEEGRKPYGGRVCDQELRRRGIPLYEVPRQGVEAAAWMQVGFRIYEILQDLGYRLAKEAGMPRSVIEVYPHGTFVSLLGGVPAKKSTARGQAERMEILRRHGLSWDHRFDHDSLDALAALLTAQKFLTGEASAVGESKEALVWLPVRRLHDSYSRLPKPQRLEEVELEQLHRLLSPEEREELLQCLLIAAPRGGEAMIKVIEDTLLCHATEELLKQCEE